MSRLVTLLYIIAGLVLLPTGAMAMGAPGATLVMSIRGTAIAVLRLERISMVAEALTVHLVTALLTLRRMVLESRAWIAVFMLMALIVDALGIHDVLIASSSSVLDEIPAVYVAIASIDIAAALLDARGLLRQRLR